MKTYYCIVECNNGVVVVVVSERLGDDVVDDGAGCFGWCQRCLCGVQWCVSLILLLPSLATHVLSVKKGSGCGWRTEGGGMRGAHVCRHNLEL